MFNKLNNKLIEEIKALKNFNKNNNEYKPYENNNNDLREKTSKNSNKYIINEKNKLLNLNNNNRY